MDHSFLVTVHEKIDLSAQWIWYVLTPLIIIVGSFITIRLGFFQFRKLGLALKLMFSHESREKSSREGDITPFAAMTTALAGTVGNGNIGGVASAIFIGGPGAIFWMWVSGFLGMATKYSEALLGVKYREKHPDGLIAGGAMYYIRNGLKNRFLANLLAGLFAVAGTIGALGTGNVLQSNQIAHVLYSEFGITPYLSGIIVTFFTGLVVIGGIKRLGAVAAKIVPIMVALYFIFGLVVLIENVLSIPDIFKQIFQNAFTPSAATGGFLGASVKQAIELGMKRGLLSNEAGLGSASIAHAAAQSKSPVHQGLLGIAEVFVDTVFICTFTALVLLATGMWQTGLEGTAMTAAAFSEGVPHLGGMIVALSSFFFGFTTIIAWSYYGEQCLKYLFGIRITVIYRCVFTTFVFLGSIVSLDFVFSFADATNGIMAFPNLIALFFLSGIVAEETRNGLSQGCFKNRT